MPLEVQTLRVEGASTVVQFTAPKGLDASDLTVRLDRGKEHASLVVQTRGAAPLRVPLDASAGYSDVSTALDSGAGTLTVTFKLKPAAASAAAETVAARDASESMRSAASEPAEAAAPLPPTPRAGEAEAEAAPRALASSGTEGEEAEGAAAAAAPAAKAKKKKKKNKKKKPATEAADGAAGKGVQPAAKQPAAEPAAEPPANEPAPASAEPASEPDPAASAPPGATELGAERRWVPTRGPATRAAVARETAKFKRGAGEDRSFAKPHNAWRLLEGESGGDGGEAGACAGSETSFGAWAVFDGHGGSAAATYASNALLKMAAEALDAPAAGRAVAAADLPPVKGLPAGDAAAWRAGAELARRAPAALAAAFLRADREARRRFGEGGTTATLALLVGWDLVVANVGDSLAFLDTGAEVLQVCGNHRIDDSAAERARLEAGGAAVHPSTIDGAFAGPLRVWPGGLAMSRTIGDADAGDACAAEPAVCRVALPPAGARLILASDGLWDAVQPKTAAHHVRGLAAHEAAHRLLALAIKKDRLKDDVTVLVVDFLPDGPAEAAPPALAAGRPAAAAGARAAARVWHPLEQEVADALAVGAERRRQVLAAAGEAAADAAAVAARAAEARAEREAAAAAEAARAKAGGGTLYAELQEQRFLSPEELDAAREAAEPEPPAVDAAASPGWEAVGNAGAAAAPPRGRGGKGKGRGKERGAAAEAPASPPPAPPPQAATGARPPRGRRPREQGAAPLPPPPAAPQLPPPRVLVVPKAAPAAGTAAGAPAARQASAGAPASAPARSGDGSGAGSAQGDAPGKKRSRAGAKNRRGPGAGAPTTGAP